MTNTTQPEVTGVDAYNRDYWQVGICGNANIVTFDGEDIRPVCYIESPLREVVIAEHNRVCRRLSAAGWRDIASAPKDNKRLLYFARFNDGKLQELDFDGIWQTENESWEMPQQYSYWASARGIEEPTHWAYQDEPLPAATTGDDNG